ncbi:restriction endonuclease subunit S [Enterobacter hormaechei]|uniref:restriction endonuclease subunit S n=1 Tax=Enterobacter hormaechei TaxID=158836 RepID=UPI002A38B0E3|nr:restriction endonuclease subunit S [Enterobacter hormaechei subsp. steigerwaltii]MCU2670934.1 restriction endonuclease subunit S [Enterobacter hormaechei subsp. steigerwaltii]MCU2806466.1 restriction endonuclease subunit S [Enterobacter hormaechei subsp. steigerwaltii]MCU2846741.1 restriction endonuclease subunit S [Enterobacter hormaechei subsp. steigerwaltii]MCU2993539.1 restriction endonuclease subunit S [Enterobacter hormaechei subsp. steigerwaltii]
MVDLMVSEQRSGTTEKGVPAGFKLTEVGIIPQDWECVPFGNLFKTNIKKINVSDHELVSFIGMQDVSEDAKLKNSIQLPFKEIKSGFTYFEKGDVLLAKITPCFENGKGCHTAELPTNVGFGSTEFHVLRENEDSDSRFIYFWTTEKKFRSSLESEMVGSAGHRRVPLVAIKTYLIPCPKNRKEQRAIADTLSDVDNFIIASEKLIAKKQAIKTATMQQLLTGKTRLPQFALRDDGTAKGYKETELGIVPEDWSIFTIGDIADVKTGPFGSSLHEKDYVLDGTPIITVEHLGELGITYQNLPMVSDEDKHRLRSYQLNEGDIVFSRVGSVDRNGLICKEQSGWLFSGRLLRVRLKNNYHSPTYLSFQFHSTPFKNRVIEVAVGQTMPSLNTKILKGIAITMPGYEEQTAIATILSDMDKEIQTLQQRLDKTRQLKQGMMQELLTGKTRLI